MIRDLAPTAAVVAERALLGLADPAASLALLDRAIAMGRDPALIPEVLFWRRLIAPELPQPPHDRLAKRWRTHLAGDWRTGHGWAAMGAPYERSLALLEGDPEAQRPTPLSGLWVTTPLRRGFASCSTPAASGSGGPRPSNARQSCRPHAA